MDEGTTERQVREASGGGSGPKRPQRGRRQGARRDPRPSPAKDQARSVGGVRIVQDAEALGSLVSGLRSAGEFALDTEFIPENRLVPELGLVQVAAPGLEAVVDPLAVEDLGPLYELIADPAILKVVHSGKHDFDIFYGLASVVPRNVFDTQVAAAVIGHAKKVQVALRTLVAGFVGRELSKQEQMSNWLHRPLSPRQVEYAIADVRYLLPLREKLRERARALSRLEWLDEEMKPLTEEESYLPASPEEAYRGLDSPGLTPSQRGSLRALAEWREKRARAANRPRGWVLKDGVVKELARRQPRNREQLLAPYESAGGRPPKGDARTVQQARAVLGKQHEPLLKAIAAGARKEIPFTGTGKRDRGPVPESLALLLETWLKLRASEHGVAPELFATQEELRAIASAYPKEAPGVRPLTGYRRRILGDDLLLILSGRAVIQVGASGQAEDDGKPPIRLTRVGRLGRFVLRNSGEEARGR